METIIAKELLNEAGRVYDRRGMVGFCSWVEEYKGNSDNKIYLQEVCKYLEKCNGKANTRIFGFDSGLINKIKLVCLETDKGLNFEG